MDRKECKELCNFPPPKRQLSGLNQNKTKCLCPSDYFASICPSDYFASIYKCVIMLVACSYMYSTRMVSRETHHSIQTNDLVSQTNNLFVNGRVLPRPNFRILRRQGHQIGLKLASLLSEIILQL